MENAQRRSMTHPLVVTAAIAVIVFCAVGVAAIMGWIPKSGADAELPADAARASATDAKPAAQQQPASRPAQATRSQPPRQQVAAAAPASSPRTVCRDCGVIESVRAVEKPGEGSGLGAVAGGVIGGVVGNQIGGGRGRDLATVAGAVGGAVAGHHIEKNLKSAKIYEITVRFDDGTTRVLSQEEPPSWQAGDRVRVVDGTIRPRG